MTLPGGSLVAAAPARREPVTAASRRWDPVVGAGIGAVAGAVVSWVMHDALGDDALISVAYARTLAESGTWGVFPGIGANTQTSPLNVWVLAAAIRVFGHPIVMVAALVCACLAVLGWLAVDLARRLDVAPAAGWLAVAAVATSPVLISTVGLEAYLGAAVLMAVAVAGAAGRSVLVGLAVGLAVLTRPDLAVPAVVLAAALPLVAGRRASGLVVAGGIAALVALPWHLWSWFALGGLVPDTTWVRTGDRSGATIMGAVPGWILAYPAAAIAGLLPVAAGLVAAGFAVVHHRRPWARAVLLFEVAGWAHLLALWGIHAQGAGWYYAPIIACSAVAASLALAALVPVWSVRAGVVLVGVAAVGGLAVSGPLPWRSAPLVANLALTSQYAAIGDQLAGLTGGQPVEGPGELGALAFHSQVPVLDFLSEPAQTDRVLRARAAAGGIRATLTSWSSAHRPPHTPIATPWRLTFSDRPQPRGRVVAVWPVESPRGTHRAVLLINAG